MMHKNGDVFIMVSFLSFFLGKRQIFINSTHHWNDLDKYSNLLCPIFDLIKASLELWFRWKYDWVLFDLPFVVTKPRIGFLYTARVLSSSGWIMRFWVASPQFHNSKQVRSCGSKYVARNYHKRKFVVRKKISCTYFNNPTLQPLCELFGYKTKKISLTLVRPDKLWILDGSQSPDAL